VPRTRTTKELAQRIDLNYFKRPERLRTVRFWLSVALPLAGLAWLGWVGFARDQRVYSGGNLSAGHAVLTRDCETCHPSARGEFRDHATNQACLSCHDGPVHHANAAFEPDCASCHMEHRGRVRLISTSNQNCAQCHANLQSKGGPTGIVRKITSLQADHPEVAVLRERRSDPGTIKVNHSVHMKKGLLGPKGAVDLSCSDCHRPAADHEGWRFASPGGGPTATPASMSTTAEAEDRYSPRTARALMVPPKFAQACAACHLLQFDKRFAEQVPHDKPEVVHVFVVKKFQEYIAAHPAELRGEPPPDRRLPEKPLPPPARVLTPVQWVAEHTAEAETLLWRKTCAQCHAMTGVGSGTVPKIAVASTAEQPLPKVAAANTVLRWMPHARFDHDAHRGFSCVSCHVKAATSKDVADVLVPGIATCKSCHAPGGSNAESRCFECHNYHDWTKRKEITPSYVPHRLRASLPGPGAAPGQ
jgi:hypothetical protein